MDGANVLKSFADVESLFENPAAYHVLKCRAHDGVSLAWLNVQEVNAEVELAIHSDASSFLDVL